MASLSFKETFESQRWLLKIPAPKINSKRLLVIIPLVFLFLQKRKEEAGFRSPSFDLRSPSFDLRYYLLGISWFSDVALVSCSLSKILYI